ncbi:MAG: SAM-dependent methyltransferase [Acidimicrobiia bacterium]|nr:SAM-dependent methyltransferase [Acidimicrobiia bacterium]
MRPSLTPGEPLRFDSFMELALYGEPDGFYASGRGAGRRTGDFLTSVEVGPLFGRLVARLADRCWEELGRPVDFMLVDAGAGSGTLARSVLAARPACSGVLRYLLVERSAALRRAHEELREHPPGPCRRLESLDDLPDAPVAGLIIANELLDNLPCRLLERTTDGWAEVYVRTASADTLAEELRPLSAGEQAVADALAHEAPVGGRIPLAEGAVEWVGRALALLRRGSLVVIDYTDSSASLAARPSWEWVRTYRSGVRGHDPLRDVGAADITVEVPFDQVRAVHPGAEVCDQASFLRSLSIEEMVAEGRAVWHERAAIGDLGALEARSRVHEAEALCDPGGLGAFTVAVWNR